MNLIFMPVVETLMHQSMVCPGERGGGYIGKTTRFNHYIMEIVAKMSNPAGLPRSLVWGE